MVKINSQKEVGLQSNRVCANGEGGSLFKLKTFAVIAILVASSQGCCQSTGAVNGVKYFNLSVQTAAGDLHCLIDKEPVEVTMSSDGDAVIVSGTDYVPVDELIRCKADVPVRVRRAAPPVWGFYQT
ncbi:hypothetical protein [Burkholderia diffusa]|uniref:hypothetical protein n=1 Tax=Burkholderia diffusa TaxID=488732 RepID=UPI0012D91B1D|nr:hypothetical protein [Burkholderia diffusa]